MPWKTGERFRGWTMRIKPLTVIVEKPVIFVRELVTEFGCAGLGTLLHNSEPEFPKRRGIVLLTGAWRAGRCR
jgi:hypothetical protein